MIWKQSLSYPDYMVSENGDVRRHVPITRSYVGRMLSKHLHKQGYFYVNLTVKQKTYKRAVHRIVCEAFHGKEPFENAVVRHLDDNKTNNHWSNLCWGTQKDNYNDRILNGNDQFGEKNSSVKYSDDLIKKIKFEYDGKRGSQIKLVKKYNMSKQHISRIIKGERRAYI